MSAIGIAFNASQVKNFNQVFKKIVTQRKKNIHLALKVARNNAVEEMKEYIDDMFSAYSETGEAHRHFKFEKYQVMSGNNPTYGLRILPKVEYKEYSADMGEPPVGHYLLMGTPPHKIPNATGAEYDFDTGEFTYGTWMSFEMSDASTYFGPGPVNHPGVRSSYIDIRDHTYVTLYKHLRMVGSNKYLQSMGSMTGEAGPGADFEALEED
jgi:hypothetical protein